MVTNRALSVDTDPAEATKDAAGPRYPLRYTATLPIPPGINRTYKTTKTGQFYKDPSVKLWEENCAVLLAASGWRALPDESHVLSIAYTLYCSEARDIDSVSKALLDTIARQLSISDKRVRQLTAQKVVSPRNAHRLDVSVDVYRTVG